MENVLYNTKYLQLKKTFYNDDKEWVYAHRPNAKDVVVIVPYTKDEVLFLIEKRPPIVAENKGQYCIGVPAGLVGDIRENETIIDAIKTELLEESGLIADEIKIVSNNVASSAGCTSETFVIALAKLTNKTEIQQPINDNGVIIERVWVKHTNISNWLKDMEFKGYVLTSQALSGLFYLNVKENL